MLIVVRFIEVTERSVDITEVLLVLIVDVDAVENTLDLSLKETVWPLFFGPLLRILFIPCRVDCFIFRVADFPHDFLPVLLDSYYDSDRITFANNVEGFDPQNHDFTQVVACRKDLYIVMLLMAKCSMVILQNHFGMVRSPV